MFLAQQHGENWGTKIGFFGYLHFLGENTDVENGFKSANKTSVDIQLNTSMHGDSWGDN
jgi:hypothetical protein